MSSFPSSHSWQQANQQHLADALAEVKVCLMQHIQQTAQDTPPNTTSAVVAARPDAARKGKQPSTMPLPALEMLCMAFCLSTFERATLLLCAGVELDSHFAVLYAQAQGDPQRSWPTFSLALACLPEAYWGALAPDAPLRRWRLLDLNAQNGLTQSALRIDERILHYLTGTNGMDARLRPLLQRVSCKEELVASHQSIATQIAGAWRGPAASSLPLIQLCGSETVSRREIAAAACAQSGRDLYLLTQDALPATIAELETLMQLWEREAQLGELALMLEWEAWEGHGGTHMDAVTWLVDRISGPFLLAANERRPRRHRPMLTFDVARPTLAEQKTLWKSALSVLLPPLGRDADEQASPALPASNSADIDTHIAELTAQFDVGASIIRAASLAATVKTKFEAAEVRGETAEEGNREQAPPLIQNPKSAVWEVCRNLARPRLDDLAQRIRPAACADDLILPLPQRLILQNIVAHIRQRSTVYQTWGFAERGARGLGISALFAGPSGTGKTTAAEVLAAELNLDLYRIDLSGVVSKYIGESEKNLRRVFDAAEEGGAILLFDEADALFGKRSDVKDSHDRYANLEVSYLLQRMESYPGLAILTTNLQTALDTAFLRRIRFIVQFPFPDAAQRQEIWQRVFPPQTPTNGLDARLLAQLDVSGGTIRNIALNAAFVAADRSEVVQMKHVLRAAQLEYAKLNKSLTSAETAGWLE